QNSRLVVHAYFEVAQKIPPDQALSWQPGLHDVDRQRRNGRATDVQPVDRHDTGPAHAANAEDRPGRRVAKIDAQRPHDGRVAGGAAGPGLDNDATHRAAVDPRDRQDLPPRLEADVGRPAADRCGPAWGHDNGAAARGRRRALRAQSPPAASITFWNALQVTD